jgi:hypothetical protein
MNIIGGGNNMKHSKSLIALVLGSLLVLVIFLPSCQKDGPVNVQTDPAASQEPVFITLPAHLSLQKIVGDTALITPEHGGELKLEFHYKYIASTGVEKDLHANMRLTFPKDAVDDSLVACLSMDDQVLKTSVDITFNPHGSTFLKPALLNVDVHGMDVADMDPNAPVWLYYDDNGTWVKMVAKKVVFNFKDGSLMCQNGELPHFSRYAFGR